MASMASRCPSPSLRATFAATLRTFLNDLFDDYRPELHYMRGPGPKWREKHGQQAAPAATASANPLYPGSIPA